MKGTLPERASSRIQFRRYWKSIPAVVCSHLPAIPTGPTVREWLALRALPVYFPFMKLQQGQVWKCASDYVRVVHLERLEVGYKSFKNLKTQAGIHQHTSKKDFCRMLKGATLVSEEKKAVVPEK